MMDGVCDADTSCFSRCRGADERAAVCFQTEEEQWVRGRKSSPDLTPTASTHPKHPPPPTPPHPTLLLRLGPDSSDTTDLFWLTHTKKEIGDTCGYCVPLLLLHKHLPHLRISLQFGVLRHTDERKSVPDGRLVRFPLRFETIKDRLQFCFMLLL